MITRLSFRALIGSTIIVVAPALSHIINDTASLEAAITNISFIVVLFTVFHIALLALRRLWRRTVLTPSAGSRSRRARHEAAHVVVARALGNNATANIHESGPVTGTTSYTHPWSLRTVDRAFNDMTVGIVGNIVDVDTSHHDEGSSSDIDQILKECVLILSTGQRPTGYSGKLTIDGLIAAARARAALLLEFNTAATDTITEILIQRSQISPAELAKIPIVTLNNEAEQR